LDTELVSFIPASRSGEPAVGRTQCKFVVVEHMGVFSLVIGPVADYAYHASLVDEFCRVNEIPSAWIEKPHRIEVYDDTVDIRGGGWADIDSDRRTLSAYGASSVYGAFDAREVSRIISGLSAFSGWSVEIGDRRWLL
jgi:hypothetical protein